MSNKPQKGFTLIELMVAISIFAMVMTISIGATLSIINESKRSRAAQAIMTNLNFAIESVSRNLRYGKSYRIEDDSSKNCIIFYSQLEDKIDARYCYTKIGEKGILTKDDNINIISSDEVSLENDLNTEKVFQIIGTGRPFIKIFLRGKALISKDYAMPFAIQTGVSSRLNQN